MASTHFIFVRIIFIRIRKRKEEIFLGVGVGAKMSGVDLKKQLIGGGMCIPHRGNVHK